MCYKVEFSKYYEKDYSRLNTEKQSAIDIRLRRIIRDGYLGDYKTIQKNLYELRIFSYGGIRIYFTIKNNVVVLLLNIGGKENKEQQQKDIKRAIKIMGELC